MKKIILTAVMLLMGVTSVMAQTLRADNIDEILKSMTLEEKASLVVGMSYRDRRQASINGNGMLGGHAADVPGAAGVTKAIERLGIPATVLTDGPAGVRIEPKRKGDNNTYYCTGFPVGSLLACTWNIDLVETIGRALGNETLEYGCDVLLAPGMNIHRNPLCGRNFEYFSEDPVVTGKIAAAYVRGIQSQGVGTSIKHYAGNSQESFRTRVDEVISQRALREIYLKGFEIAVKESNPWTIMSSYNRLNGPYTQENRDLLTTILRDEWGFKGIVMTDWTEKRNTAAQIHAGNDLMEPGYPNQTNEIIEKVQNGKLSVEDLDICVKRILEYIVKTPKFRDYKFSNKPDLKAHAEVTRESAPEGMVLLKNHAATLPIAKNKKVAVYGIDAYDLIAGGLGSGDVNKEHVIDLVTGLKDAGYDVNKPVEKVYNTYKELQKNIGDAGTWTGWNWTSAIYPELDLHRDVIDEQADSSDIAIVAIGRQAGEGHDRMENNDFKLTDVEQKLIGNICDAYHLVNKPVVVVLNMGGVLETSSWKSKPDAILLAWQPGQEGGYSIADVLSGKKNPSGKLTMTWPVTLSDVPSSICFPNVRDSEWVDGGEEFYDVTLHKEGLNIGYRFFNTVGREVSYPFGYGLSYTTFAYSKPVVKANKDGFTAQVTVTNTGSVAGKEAVQLYVSAPDGGLVKPAQELKAFAKTRELKPGESQVLTMNVSSYELASFNEKTQCWETAAGRYTVKFGASVEDIRQSATYTQPKAESVQCHDVLKPNRKLN